MSIDCAQFEKHKNHWRLFFPTLHSYYYFRSLATARMQGLLRFCSHYTHVESSICVRNFLFKIGLLHPYEHFLPEPRRKLFISGSNVLQGAEDFIPK